MHIIIPMAGHSRRFAKAGLKKPKSLLPVGPTTMIEQVVEMFSPDDDYHFIINKEQASENPQIIEFLEGLAKKSSTVVIASHEEGPIRSVLQVPGISTNAPLIVSYCDFTVTWNYSQFLRHIHDCDAAVPSFQGFHPASFGNTLYAYMRTDGDRMLELREKENFTKNKIKEHASVGIYYFRSWSLLVDYGKRVQNDKDNPLSEGYVSQICAKMANDRLRVLIHEVKNFICLGTPEDYEQHQFWWRFYSQIGKKDTLDRSKAVKRINLLPMAGSGSRFKEYGYRVAKPLIQVRQQPMVLRASQSMPEADWWIFLPRAEDIEKHPIAPALESLFEEVKVIPVEGPTSGQAATCLLAADLLENDAELTISSCDYESFFDVEGWHQILEDENIDGAIWTYRHKNILIKNPEAFAYCHISDDGFSIKEVVEKKTISATPENDHLVIGTFWFRRAEDFIKGAQTMIEKKITVNNEHYVATSINQLIEENKKFIIFEVDQWISYGDPFEISVLEYWEDYFFRLENSSRNAF